MKTNSRKGEKYLHLLYESQYTKDIQGSSRDLLDNFGQMVVRYGYDNFGETRISGRASGVTKNEIAYTGGIYDQEMKQYYLNARYYNPEDGVFLRRIVTGESRRIEERGICICTAMGIRLIILTRLGMWQYGYNITLAKGCLIPNNSYKFMKSYRSINVA